MLNPLAMPFKLNFSPDKAFALTNHSVIRLQGPDSKAFLQSLCMNDVNLLGDGDWQYNGWLNPQGRILALFYLLHAGSGHLCLILPELSAQGLIDSLQKYKLRAKVELSLDREIYVNGRFYPAKTDHSHESASLRASGPLKINLPDATINRSLTLESMSAEPDTDALDLWHCLDIQKGWIWLNETQQNRWTPQMLSLERISAYSLKKGCYPGQEIVARTHYLGKSKRALVTVNGTGLQIDQSLTASGQDFGVIVNTDASGSFAAAVISSDPPAGPWLSSTGALVRPVSN
jgi:folate-binding protein YgfZ